MPSNKLSRLLGTLLLFTAASAQAQLPWSEETHQLAFGDFNGDGKTDLLYVARNPGQSSGIALSSGSGPYSPGQSWPSNHLGIAWHSGTYAPVVADFNGDGKADIFLQRQTQGDHYLLHADAQGEITAINQTLPFNHGGQIWSADGHRIVAGDFDGDDKADLFLQSVAPSGLNAVFLANASGTFGSAQQTWGNTHIGFNWSLKNAVVHTGDFNGDGKADLFVQAKPDIVIIDYEVPFPVFAYRTGSFGVANAKEENGNGEIFYTPALQIWDRNFLGADWSAASYDAVVGDFNGDGRADVILQGKKAGSTNSLFHASPSGQFASVNALTDPALLVATGNQYRLHAANFEGTPCGGIYLQALSGGGMSSISSVCDGAGSAVSKTMTYAYDALGRLTFVTDTQNGNRDYDYDKAGNRLLVAVGGSSDTANEPGPAVPPVPTGLSMALGSFCVWNVGWTATTGATSYTITTTLGAVYPNAGIGSSFPWSTNCPSGSPNDRKPLYLQACNAAGCSEYAQFPP